MKKYYFTIFLIFSVIGLTIILWSNLSMAKELNNLMQNQDYKLSDQGLAPDFNGTFVLEEAGKMADSQNPDWWLNSGGLAYFDNNNFKTIQGELTTDNRWFNEYKRTNPRDTDGGYYPQNIFRLVTRSKWQDQKQKVYFKINKDNLSESKYRNQSNGLLLFNRYQDGNNLYYTGIRVDGNAVIKKKIKGVYYTMAIKKIFLGNAYNRITSPNLLPKNVWLGVKSEIRNNNDGTVLIKLYIDKENSGNWQSVLEAGDNGKNFGGMPFIEEGYGGIRTDFMDVEMKDYKISNLVK